MPEDRIDSVPTAPDQATQAAGPGHSYPGDGGVGFDGRDQFKLSEAEEVQTNHMPDSATESESTKQPIPFWLQQLERVMRVLVRLYLGLLVCFAPWYPQAWDNNPLIAQSPSVQHFLTQGFVRGLISGLGLLNLWIAISDALTSGKDETQR